MHPVRTGGPTETRRAASRECLLRLRSSAGQLESPAGELLELRAFGVGRRAQIDEPRVLAGALQNAATVIESPAAVKPDVHMVRQGADPDDVLAIDCETDVLPHHARGARGLHRVNDLFGSGGYLPHHTDRRLQRRADCRGNFLDLFSDCAHDWHLLAKPGTTVVGLGSCGRETS